MGWSKRGAVSLVACVALVGVLTASAQDGVAGPSCVADVMFVLDRSTSMEDSPSADTARAGSVALVRTLTSSDQSGIRSFPQTLEDKGLDQDHAATEAAMSALPVGYLEPTPDGWAAGAQGYAIAKAHEQFDVTGRPHAYRAIVVMSDGQTEDSSVPADAAKADGIRIFSIAIGGAPDWFHMWSIASSPKDTYFRWATTPDEARTAMEDVLATVVSCGIGPAFEAEPTCAPGTVTFTDASVSAAGPIVRQHWVFGDGQEHTFQAPSFAAPVPQAIHMYAGPGTYDVALTVTTDAGASNTATGTVVVPPCPPPAPRASFVCQQQGGQPLAMRFIDASVAKAGAIVAWDWTFGDGGSSHERDPVYIYDAEAAHLVRLEVRDSNGMVGSTVRLCDPRNAPPTLFVADATVYEGQLLEVEARGADADGDPLQYAYFGLPPGAAAQGAWLTWPTQVGDAGIYPLRAHVDDGRAGTDTEFRLEVLPMPVARRDADRDGRPDVADDCPDIATRGACRAPARKDAAQPIPVAAMAGDDIDRDGIPDPADNCRTTPNRDQGDLDQDGRGDRCDDDADGDRVPDGRDNCPRIPNPGQDDQDSDGRGDVCDPFLAASMPSAGRPASAAQPASTAPAAAAPPAGVVDGAPTGLLAVGGGLGLLWALVLVGVASARRR